MELLNKSAGRMSFKDHVFVQTTLFLLLKVFQKNIMRIFYYWLKNVLWVTQNLLTKKNIIIGWLKYMLKKK